MTAAAILSVLAAMPSPASAGLLPRLEEDAQWESRVVRAGLVHYQAYFDDLFGAPQIVNVLAVDLDGADLRLEFTAVDVWGLRRMPIPDLGRYAGALAAINGGFATRQARSEVGFGIMKFRGEVWPFGNDVAFPNHEAEGRNALGIDADGAWHFVSRGAEGWELGALWNEDWPEVEQAMAGGSRIVIDGEVHPLVVRSTTRGAYLEDAVLQRLTFRRHPRTLIGVTENRVGLLVTVSGRHQGKAAGMTLEEAGRLMASLGARDALELDGGGSTTMWIQGYPGNGVVSYPSDNGQFDQEGTRSLRLAVLVMPRD